jgi:hypothetical protein
MAAIYCADIWCDDCADRIKERIAANIWDKGTESVLPDGEVLHHLVVIGHVTNCEDLLDYLDGMPETTFDSDDYPKWADDDEESDCPQHCAGGAGCENYSETSDGERYGYFFGNSLTSDGYDYVVEAVTEDLLAGRTDSPAVELWKPCYDFDGLELPIDQCSACGDWFDKSDLDDEYICEDCANV